MLSRFRYGTIVDHITGEDIKNNDIYILDPSTSLIRKARDCDEWLTCQLVYVYDCNHGDTIKNGMICRCWMCYLVI